MRGDSVKKKELDQRTKIKIAIAVTDVVAAVSSVVLAVRMVRRDRK